jgi:CysZ protein
MSNFEQFKFALPFWRKAWIFIFKNNLGYYFLFPILITATLYFSSFFLIDTLVDWLNAELLTFFGLDKELNSADGGGFFPKLVHYLITFFGWIAGLIVFYKTSKYATLILMSPVMSALSSKTDEIITGKKSTFSAEELFKDIIRGTALSIRNFFIELGLNTALFLINVLIAFIFPPLDLIISPASAIASFLVSAYFFGFAAIDYTLENRRYSFRQSIEYMRKNRGMAIGNGTFYALLFSIPVIGVTLSTILSTVAGTLMVNAKEG